MGNINRLTLPEEFYDITSSKVLRAPEPQYLHAVLWKMAFNMGLQRKMGGIGLMAGRMAGGAGAPYPEAQAFYDQLSDPIMGDALSVVPNTEAKVGHTVRINRPRFSDTTYTEQVREITRTSISTTPIGIGSEQVAVTIKQFAGPYDQANSRVAPYGLDSFDASRAIHDLGDEVGTHLQRDFDKTLDSFIGTLYDSADTANIVWPTEQMTADNDIAAVAAGGFNFSMILRGIQALEDAKAPKFPNGDYVAVIGPREKRQLAEDDEFQRASSGSDAGAPKNPLLAATFYKRVNGCSIFVSQTLRSVNNASSVPIRRNQMFGPAAVGGIVVPVAGQGPAGPRVLSSTDDNYGLVAKVIWALEGGWTVFDNRFIASLRTG